MYLFFRFFADGFFFVVFFRLALAAIVLPDCRHSRDNRAARFHLKERKRARTGPTTDLSAQRFNDDADDASLISFVNANTENGRSAASEYRSICGQRRSSGAGQLAAKRCRKKVWRETAELKTRVQKRYPASQLCDNLDQRRINCETSSPPTELPIACLVESVQSDYAGENEHSGCGYVIQSEKSPESY